jgi:hypothetical protein
MARKSRTPRYLSAEKVLSPEEYAEYKRNRENIQRMNLLERTKELKSENKYRTAKKNYEEGTTWKKYYPNKVQTGIRKTNAFFARNLPKAISSVGQRGGIARSLYRSQGQLPPTNIQNRFKTIQGLKSGKIGRPKGTYDKRYSSFGGVYNFRKLQAMERFKQRQQILQDRALTPQQQYQLQLIRQREQASRTNIEAQTFPDTRGQVDIDSITREINDAANIFS